MLSGHLVTLGDGQRWRVPIARAIDAEAELLTYGNVLPRAVDVDDDGEWTPAGTVARYAPLWEIATSYWHARVHAEELDEGIKFDFAGERDAALAALAANYRIGKAEVGLLGLFNDQAILQILDALIDMPTFEAWCKKKLAAASVGSSTGAGPAASLPATNPVSPISAPSPAG
jgi:hypothetical protein